MSATSLSPPPPPPPPPVGEVVYDYDLLGRIKQVTALETGETGTYKYDAVGNLLSIFSQKSGQGEIQTKINEILPNSGSVGTAVTIYGSGFSATPSQNTVTFGGVAGIVTSSTATKITTTVPAGAITATITVTTPYGSAISDTPFTVGVSKTSRITGFTPTKRLVLQAR